MGVHGRCWWVVWGWDGGGRHPPLPTYRWSSPWRGGGGVGPYVISVLVGALVCCSPGSAQDDTTTMTTSLPSQPPTALYDNTSSSLAFTDWSGNPSPSLVAAYTTIEHDHGHNWSTNCETNDTWPILVDKSKSILVGFLPTRVGDRRERLGLKIPGAFTYAVENINNRSVLPDDYILTFEVQDTEGREDLSSKHVVDMLCKGVSAIFGPEHTCYVEGTIAQGKNLPIISYACSNERASKFTTFIRTNPSEIYIIKTTVATLRHNNWNKFSIIYTEDNLSMKETLKEEARKENMTINHEILYNVEQLPFVFQETKNSTRIYVFIGHRNSVNQLLTVMAMTGIFKPKETEKKYLLLFVEREEYMPADWLTYIWDFHSLTEITLNKQCFERDVDAYNGAFVVVANRFPDDSPLKENVREYNKKEPFCLGYHSSLTRDRPISEEMSELL